jgi:hypothetical protein
MTHIHQWSRLTTLHLGRYAEYFVKMEFTLHGFDVYSAEVDDKGIDSVIRKHETQYYDVQVKSARELSYIFFPKEKLRRPRICSRLLCFLRMTNRLYCIFYRQQFGLHSNKPRQQSFAIHGVSR